MDNCSVYCLHLEYDKNLGEERMNWKRNDVGFLSPFLRYQEVRDVKVKKLDKFYCFTLHYWCTF